MGHLFGNLERKQAKARRTGQAPPGSSLTEIPQASHAVPTPTSADLGMPFPEGAIGLGLGWPRPRAQVETVPFMHPQELLSHSTDRPEKQQLKEALEAMQVDGKLRQDQREGGPVLADLLPSGPGHVHKRGEERQGDAEEGGRVPELH